MAKKVNKPLMWLQTVALGWGSDDCLMWPFGVDRDGYGRLLGPDGVETRSHRMIFFMATKRWPTPCALHSCDTPGCCNLRHISEGTHQKNQRQKAERGRSLRGVQQHDAKLTDSIVAVVRSEYASGKASFSMLAKEHGVSAHCMKMAIRGISWRHIGNPVPTCAVRRFIKTHCKYGHFLSESNLYVYGNKRQCKICTTIRCKKYRGIL